MACLTIGMQMSYVRRLALLALYYLMWPSCGLKRRHLGQRNQTCQVERAPTRMFFDLHPGISNVAHGALYVQLLLPTGAT